MVLVKKLDKIIFKDELDIKTLEYTQVVITVDCIYTKKLLIYLYYNKSMHLPLKKLQGSY